jgi:ribonuclease J
MHQLLRPGAVIPMHGEHRHLVAQAELAGELGIRAVVAPNGTMLDLTGDRPAVAGHVETGRLYLDGSVLIGALDGVVRDRLRMALRGHLTVSLIFDEAGRPTGGSWVRAHGLPDSARHPDGVEGACEAAVDQSLGKAKRAELDNDEAVERLAGQACTRTCLELIGKKPVVSVMISRLE